MTENKVKIDIIEEMETEKETEQLHLPIDTAWLFPEYAFEDIHLETHRGVIIERILERGSWEQVRWMFRTYSEEKVADWVQQHGFRLLSKRSFAFWRLVLKISNFHAPDWAIQAREAEAW